MGGGVSERGGLMGRSRRVHGMGQVKRDLVFMLNVRGKKRGTKGAQKKKKKKKRIV